MFIRLIILGVVFMFMSLVLVLYGKLKRKIFKASMIISLILALIMIIWLLKDFRLL